MMVKVLNVSNLCFQSCLYCLSNLAFPSRKGRTITHPQVLTHCPQLKNVLPYLWLNTEFYRVLVVIPTSILSTQCPIYIFFFYKIVNLGFCIRRPKLKPISVAHYIRGKVYGTQHYTKVEMRLIIAFQWQKKERKKIKTHIWRHQDSDLPFWDVFR